MILWSYVSVQVNNYNIFSIPAMFMLRMCWTALPTALSPEKYQNGAIEHHSTDISLIYNVTTCTRARASRAKSLYPETS